MTSYAESAVCRRKQLLHYFGESYEGDCGFCDNCVHPKESISGEEFILSAIVAADQTKQRFGANHLADVIKGSVTQYVKSYGHDQLGIFGKGNEETIDFWKSVVRQTLLNDFLVKDIDNIGVLKITGKGIDFMKNPFPVKIFTDHDYDNLGEEEEHDTTPTMSKAHDENLFALLKGLRKQVAKEKGFPPYVIFQDPSLEEMATTYPTTKEELSTVNGVGMGKVNKFGGMFIKLIEKYVDENDITTAADVVVKSSINKSKIKIFIIQQVDNKVDLEEISEVQRITMDELLTEIENIIYSGTKLTLDYYIDQVVEMDKQDDLHDYFINAETDDINIAFEEESNLDYTEEEIRLMRIKFLSEYAN
jgi:ATP-dependent DNA helicase RecQ